MLAKYITTGLVGSALLATVAFAQTPSATSDKANANAVSTEFKGDWRASKVVGLNVYNDNNEKIGSINDLLMDKNGKINAAVIGVGGFLGVGEHLVAISFDKMKFSTEPASYTGASNAPAGGNRPASTSTTGSANTTSSSTSASKSNPWYPDHAIFNASKDDLKKMPEFKYSE